MKTLGIRLEDELHAQLSLLVRLRPETTMNGTIVTAIQEYLQRRAGDGDLSAQAELALAEVEREAAERRRAIATLFGPGSAGTTEPTKDAGGEAEDASAANPTRGRAKR